MKKTRVYDLPTRLFHWVFVFLFMGAFFIAKVFDDESAQYPYHMILGFTLALTVVLRILWGFFGSQHARFTSFKLNPHDLFEYLKNLLSSKTPRYLGHNPASSWAAIIMMTLSLGLALSGYFMVNGTNKEIFEELHELLANAFILVVIGHVAGIILHTIKHKDSIGLSMVHGKKKAQEGDLDIKSSHPLIAIIFIALVGSFFIHLNKNYDPNTQNLKFLGSTLHLSEADDDHQNDHDNDHDDHDDDD